MTSNSCQLVLLVEALAFAARKHHGQTRKDAAGTPYLEAVIRTLRYKAGKFAAFASEPIDTITQAESAQVGAAGQEIAELFDFDIAL